MAKKNKNDLPPILPGNMYRDQFENTRLSCHQTKLNSRNHTGTKGVSWDSVKQRYIAQLRFGGENVLYKRFLTLEEAIAARKAAEAQYIHPLLDQHPNFRKNASGPGETML